MARHSDQYIAHAQRAEGQEWSSPHPYVEGVRVLWRGVRLLCTRHHYAGDAAEHPWDPGDGWPPSKAAALWTPDGDEELWKLRNAHRVDDPGRLRDVINYACGDWS